MVHKNKPIWQEVIIIDLALELELSDIAPVHFL